MLQALSDKFDTESIIQVKQNKEVLGKLSEIQTTLTSLDNRISHIKNKTSEQDLEIDAIKLEISTVDKVDKNKCYNAS